MKPNPSALPWLGSSRYPNELINAVALGVRNHMYLKHGGDDTTKLSDKTLRKFAARVGNNLEKILDLIHADNIAHSEHGAMPNQIEIVRKRLSSLDNKLTQKEIKLPINGNDLKQLGIKPSPLYKEIMEKIQELWFENPQISKEEAITFIKNNYI
jgi:hypothetical protein